MISWNSCAEEMPSTVGDYLICYEAFGYQYIDIGYITDDEFMIKIDDGYVEVNATHWAELNKPRLIND